MAMESRSQVPVTIDVGDWFTELGQISGSHAVLTFVHLDAQPELDPVGDVEPV